uniref:Uncharacterized protein n=1 Tax=Arundo donax TaxID=35708 RepID=A0A0A9GW27_ARUDO
MVVLLLKISHYIIRYSSVYLGMWLALILLVRS